MPGVRAVVTHEDVPGDAAARPRQSPTARSSPPTSCATTASPSPPSPPTTPTPRGWPPPPIIVEYEVLEPVTDPEQAFEAEPLHPDGNLIRHIPLRYGDPDAVGEVVVEGLYRIGRQDPAPIGAEAGLAVPRPDGGVELYLASTDPHADRDLAAACFGLEPDRVKVVVTGVPGATGDREDPGFQLPLGLLALRTGCPVKLAATREESFLGHAHRHPTLLRYRHHADAEGRLVKVEAQILLDAGAYADTSSEALAAAVAFACGPYVVPHAFIEGWAVRTNNPPSGHVRGEGAMQVCAAYEGQMDKLADEARPRPGRAAPAQRHGHRRPAAHRPDRDLPGAGRRTPAGRTGLPAARRCPRTPPRTSGCCPAAPRARANRARCAAASATRLGMVHMLGAEGADEVSTATVKVHDGVATVICAAVETGQGFTTLARQIVQETLGIDEVHVAPVDTDQPPAGAGRPRPPHLGLGRRGGARGEDGPHPAPPAARRTSSACPRSCSRSPTARSPRTTGCCPPPSRRRWTARSCGPPPSAARTPPSRSTSTGQGDAFVGPRLLRDPRGRRRRHRTRLGAGGGAGASPRTSAGSSTRRQLAARIEAGVTQGVGMALTENLRTARGLIRHPDLTGYALPTALDAPDIRIVKLVEERDVVAPFGAKAVSAVPVVTSPAAVASAVRAATGRPVNRLPIRPQAAVVTDR